MNKAMLIGWLIQQPEIKVNAEGTLQCSVDIAVERIGNVPDNITLIASGKLAEEIADFNKGEQIGVTGSIKTRLEEKKFTRPVKMTEVLVEMIHLGKKQECPLDDDFLPSILTHSVDE